MLLKIVVPAIVTTIGALLALIAFSVPYRVLLLHYRASVQEWISALIFFCLGAFLVLVGFAVSTIGPDKEDRAP